MSSTASSRICASAFLLGALAGCATQSRGDLLFADDFRDANQWVLEAEGGERVVARDGVLDIDTPAGLTLWFKHRLEGPVEIEFEATAVARGGPNDHVSDLNVFWMATNADGSEPLNPFRQGHFGAYDVLKTYYVGLGGNRNTTTRFRRYLGQPGNRPLLPGHDLKDAADLLVANRRQKITLIANGGEIEYRRDGRTLFRYHDEAPYVSGWFALRTTASHLRIEHLRIRRPAG